MLFLRVESIELHRLFAHFLCCRNYLLTDRIAGKYYSVGWKESFHSVIRNADAFGLLAHYLVCQSGIAVLLLNKGRYTKSSRCPEEGSTGIATYTDCDVRFELTDESLCH